MESEFTPKGILVTDEENYEERVPCVIVIDCSYSMATDDRIDALNHGLAAFEEALKNDPKAKRSSRIMLIRVGGFEGDTSEVKILREFHDGAEFSAPKEVASGSTPLGEAVLLGLEMIEKEKTYLRSMDLSNNPPWMFVISDGKPTDTNNWEIACEKARAAVQANKAVIYVVGVDGANVEELQKLTPEPAALIGSVDFRKFFIWLSASIGRADVGSPVMDFEIK